MKDKNWISFKTDSKMTLKMLLLAFSLLLTSKVTLGEYDCASNFCERPEQLQGIPREVSDFNTYCVGMKSHLRCTKEWQDNCGEERRVVFFETQEIYQATYDTISDMCEEGTLLNTVVTGNLRCLNETFGRTRCHEEAAEFLEPFIREVQQGGTEPKFSIFCLQHALVHGCVTRAISDNCGQLVGQAAMDVLNRSKTIENACSPRGAKSILDELETLDLSEAKKRTVTQILEKIAEPNSE